MTPLLESSRCATSHTSSDVRLAATIVQAAAEALADEVSEAREISRYLRVADRLSTLLDSPKTGSQRFLQASPAVTEKSGRYRTLIEMIEAEPGDYSSRLRLAKLLLRAIVWLPKTFPIPEV